MTDDYPDDPDGNLLRQVAADGNDMRSPMVIDFAIHLPTQWLAAAFACMASARGHEIHVRKAFDDGDGWDVFCAVKMLATYDGVVRVQRELTEWAAPFGGRCDDWGTLGNQPAVPRSPGITDRPAGPAGHGSPR